MPYANSPISPALLTPPQEAWTCFLPHIRSRMLVTDSNGNMLSETKHASCITPTTAKPSYLPPWGLGSVCGGGRTFLVKYVERQVINMPHADPNMEMRLVVGPGAPPHACGFAVPNIVSMNFIHFTALLPPLTFPILPYTHSVWCVFQVSGLAPQPAQMSHHSVLPIYL